MLAGLSKWRRGEMEGVGSRGDLEMPHWPWFNPDTPPLT